MRQRRRFTLAYAVAFLFDTPGTRFEMGRKVYQYVATSVFSQSSHYDVTI